jgi:glycerol-3-phosphate dehydrogenase
LGLCRRALYDDGAGKPQDIGRDYALVLDKGFGVAPLLTVYGGKLTTFRRLAEDALSRLAPYFPPAPPWTANSTLPGGDFAYDGMATLVERTRQRWPFLRKEHAERLVSAYGTRVDQVLQTAKRPEDLGVWLGADLTAAEVHYLMAKEGAQTADDVLWRRSKVGLRLAQNECAALELFMTAAAR